MPDGPDTRRGPAPWAIVGKALLYAVLITALVLYAPIEPHVFIYQAF